MTDLQHSFLLRYKSLDCPCPRQLTPDDRIYFESCRKAGYIEHVTPIDGTWYFRISDIGLAAMKEFENEAKQVADEISRRKADQAAQEQSAQERWRKDSNRSWLQFWLNVIFSAVGFAVGIFVEHYFAIFELIISLF